MRDGNVIGYCEQYIYVYLIKKIPAKTKTYMGVNVSFVIPANGCEMSDVSKEYFKTNEFTLEYIFSLIL